MPFGKRRPKFCRLLHVGEGANWGRSKRQSKAFGFHRRNLCGTLLSVPPFVPAQAGTNEIAYEDIMINAAEYRAMASEHHRLAGMCRSPESREQHFRLEKDFLALAASEECLHGTRAAQHPSHSESAG